MGKLLVENSVVNADGIKADGAAKTVVAQASSWAGGSVVISISRDGGTTKIPLKKGDADLSFDANGNDQIDAVKIGLLIFAEVTGSPVGLNVELF